MADAPLSACGKGGGQGFNTGDGSNGKHRFMCILATKRKEKQFYQKRSILSIQKWELLQRIQTQGSIITEKTRQFSNLGRLLILLENKNIQLGMDFEAWPEAIKKKEKGKKKKKEKFKL